MKDTKTKHAQEELSARRGFLKGAAVTTAAVGTGALASTASADEQIVETAKGKLGYQETDHVREYYKLARF